MSDTLTLLYILSCIYCAKVTYFLIIFIFLLITFSGKKIVPPPPLFVTELHNYGCAGHKHVFLSQLAPSIRFYIL